MKFKLTILLFFIVFGLYAQKQLQPYNYSVSKDGKTETIMIYASAEAVNSIMFTLKNEKNEALKTKKENSESEDIKFKVFPFTETSFRKFLVDAINSISQKDESDKEEYGIFKEILAPLKKTEDETKNLSKEKLGQLVTKRKDAVQNVRNIFQFFDALVITAFQYDTEPVAGLLKYRLDSLVITKKTIQGLSTDLYFKKQAKFIRKHIIYLDKQNIKDANNSLRDCCRSLTNKKSKEECLEKIHEKLINLGNNKAIIISDYVENETDGFLKYLRTHNQGKTIKQFYEFNENSKKGLWNKAKPTFKRYVMNKLKEYYNDYELYELKKSDFFKKYVGKLQKKEKIKNEIIKIEGNKKIIDLTLKDSSDTKEKYIKKSNVLKKGIRDILDNKENYYINNIEELEIRKREIDNELYILLDESNVSQTPKNTDSLEEEYKKLTNDIRKKWNLYYKSNPNNSSIKVRKSKSLIDTINEKIKSYTSAINTLKSKLGDINSKINTKISVQKSIQDKINTLIINNKEIIRRFPLWVLKANEIELDINDGFLEHVKAVGEIKKPLYDDDTSEEIKQFFEEPIIKDILNDIYGKTLKFDNDFPFGFSSKSDFADLYKYSLFQSEGKEKKFSLPVTEIITYYQKHQNDRLDFSPKDQVVRLPLEDTDKDKQIELKKEVSSKVLSAKIYTDFNGFQKDKENGLAQMEIEKLIPIWTKRLNLGLGRGSNFGFANYVNFNLSWQKINEDDRELQASKSERFINNEPVTDKFVSYLDLVKYENVSVGVDLNIASFDFPLVKTRIELNAGTHFGRINVIDDIVTDSQNPETKTRELDKTINMIRAYPDVIVRIRPEERFGGYLRFRPFRTIVPNNEEFFAVSSTKKFKENRSLTKSWLHRYELGASYTPSVDSDNKFFFRYRYTNTSQWETNGYSEIQVGYLIYLKF
ncbi:hypothetical protein Q4Q34_06100 [Flavivirga abyssicola]|uniref:hypothetical protein n=1 Tax=Flavivirga abyssicola TaxID=3063533 RepID=UPI0026DF50D5|nr:hypothetical protein [Flavivirga sp. MEBiC07777]WVK14600.1 hypothetical protein Q4Q34_06100 [Flavivirga sp. MEBiC07777]